MINNFENFSWDYDPKDDPYAKRMKTPLDMSTSVSTTSKKGMAIVQMNQPSEKQRTSIVAGRSSNS